MTAAETESAQTKASLARLTERKETVETERDKARGSGVRLMKERDDALKASGCGADRLIPLPQRTADGHGESLAGRRIRRSLSSRGSWLRDTKRRTIYVSRSTAEVLPLPPHIISSPCRLASFWCDKASLVDNMRSLVQRLEADRDRLSARCDEHGKELTDL